MRMRRRSKEQDLKPAQSLEDSLDRMSPNRPDDITSLWLMMKRGGLMSAAFLTWRRRFVKIEGENLVMFSDDGPGADFKGTVPIRGMSVSLARAKNALPQRPKCVQSHIHCRNMTLRGPFFKAGLSPLSRLASLRNMSPCLRTKRNEARCFFRMCCVYAALGMTHCAGIQERRLICIQYERSVWLLDLVGRLLTRTVHTPAASPAAIASVYCSHVTISLQACAMAARACVARRDT